RRRMRLPPSSHCRPPPPPRSAPIPCTTLSRSLLDVRDRTSRVLATQSSSTSTTADREQARARLNASYDDYVQAYGPLNRFTISEDRKSTRLNASHVSISYAVFRLEKNSRHARR